MSGRWDIHAISRFADGGITLQEALPELQWEADFVHTEATGKTFVWGAELLSHTRVFVGLLPSGWYAAFTPHEKSPLFAPTPLHALGALLADTPLVAAFEPLAKLAQDIARQKEMAR